MYQPMYTHRRPKRMGSYFLPFLSLIILGLIGVLVFQIFSYFQDKRDAALENKAAVKIVAGRAEMKIWGVDQWTNAVDGSILNEGDQVRTAPGSRVVLTLLNGSIVRVNSESEVELTGLKSIDGEDNAEFTLKSGELWLRHSENKTVKSSFQVKTSNLNVYAIGTTFDIAQNGSEQTVHVLDGKVKVNFTVTDTETQKTRIAETVEVALGQEVSISSSEISNLQTRKPIDVLALLSDSFRNTEWYGWNRSQDTTGSIGVSVADAVGAKPSQAVLSGLQVQPVVTETEPGEVTEVISGPLPAPIIITPKLSERSTKTGYVSVTGTTDKRTSKMEVAIYDANGKPDPYLLQKYTAGSTTWSYIASKDYGNLRAGENRYTITAIAADGTRSESVSLIIQYDRPKEPSDLSAPKVLSYNGSESSDVDSDSVKVEGTIGKGIEKIYVNGFALSKYVMNSGSWTYYAKTAIGNLKDGENSYEVYGVDIDGKKTPVTSFTITKSSAAPAPDPLPLEAPAL